MTDLQNNEQLKLLKDLDRLQMEDYHQAGFLVDDLQAAVRAVKLIRSQRDMIEKLSGALRNVLSELEHDSQEDRDIRDLLRWVDESAGEREVKGG